jgi:hypothetical protein
MCGKGVAKQRVAKRNFVVYIRKNNDKVDKWEKGMDLARGRIFS